AAAQWLFNAAMSANPIALVSIAVAALAAAIVVLWKKSETFRTIVLAVWAAVKNAAIVAWNAIKTVIGAVIGWIGRTISPAGRAISAVWNAVKTTATTAWNAIKVPVSAVITWIAGKVSGVITTVTTWWNKLKGIATRASNAVKQPVSDVITWITTKWSDFIAAVTRI